MRRPWLGRAALLVPVIVALGILSGRLSGSGYGNAWFDALDKPWFMPPGWLFPVAWTILYALLGIAAARIWVVRDRRRGSALRLFGVHLALNLAWSPLFFGLHQAAAGLALIVVLLVTAVLVARRFHPLDRTAALLLLPYLAWLSFATLLNAAIVWRN